MSFDEQYKKWKQEQAKKSSTERTVSSFDAMYNEYKWNTNGQSIIDDLNKKVQSWLSKNENFVNNYNKRFGGDNTTYRGDSADWLSSVTSQKNNFDMEADSILSIVNQYKDKLGSEYVSQVTSAINGNRKVQEGILSQSTEDNQFWSKFETEDAYNDFVKSYKIEQDYLKYDIDAGRVEIGTLQDTYDTAMGLLRQQEMNMAYDPNRTTDITEVNAQLQTQFDELVKPYGGLDGLKNTIAEKNAYLNRAKYKQEGHALESVSDPTSDRYDPSFGVYASKGAGIKNPTPQEAEMGIWRKPVENIVTYSRENWEQIAMAEANGSGAPASGAKSLYRWMTDDEVAVYNYYLGKGDKKSAEEYLKRLEETLNGRQGSAWAESMDGSIPLQYLFGVVAGLDQFGSGMRNLFSTEDYIPSSAVQQASAIVIEDLADDGFKIFGKSIGQAGYDAITTISNQAPSILASIAANYIAPGSGAIVGNIVLGASATGNAYAEAINYGFDKGQARSYSTMVGASEALVSYLLGGISALGGKVSGNVVSKILSKVDNTYARAALQLGGSMFSEGLEESIQEVLDPWFKHIATGVNYEAPDIDQVLYSGLLGALSAGVLEGVGTVSSIGKIHSDTKQQGKALKEAGLNVDRLKALGTTFSADTVAYKLANKVDAKTGAYKIAKLFNEVGAELTEANQADIVKSLVRKGYAETHAKTVAESLASVISGAELNTAQKAALEQNTDIGRTIMDVIINPNSTVNQRVKQASNLFDTKTATETAAETTEETAPTMTAPLSAEEMARRVAQVQSGDLSELRAYAELRGLTSTEGNSSANTETAEIGSYEVNTDGKTILKDTGAEVEIVDVAAKNGKTLTYKTADGQLVDSSNVSYKSEEAAVLHESFANLEQRSKNPVIQQMDAPTIGRLINYFNPESGVSVPVYAEGVQQAYFYGFRGIPMTNMPSELDASRLTPDQRQYAYDLGMNAAKEHFGAIDKGVKELVKKAKAINAKKGKPSTYTGKVYLEKGITESNMDEKTKAAYEAAKIATSLGVDIHLYNGVSEYGYYDRDTGEIYININSMNNGQNIMAFVLSHELTHFMQQWNAAKFKVFADFLLSEYGKKGVSVQKLIAQQKADARENGREIDSDEAYDEVIADACQRLFLDSNAMEKLQKLRSKDKTTWEAIKSKIREWINKIRAMFADVEPYTTEAQILSEMKDVLENINTMFSDTLIEAGENYSAIRQAFGKGAVIEVNDNGEFVIAKSKKRNGETRKFLYNDFTWDNGGRETLEKSLRMEGFSDEDVTAAMVIMQAKHDLVKRMNLKHPAQAKVSKVELTTNITADRNNCHSVMSAIIQNGDYPVNIDLMTICKKRQAYQDVINHLCETGLIDSVTLDSLAIAEINRILGSHGFETACLGCFVESRRLHIQKFAQTICDDWNAEVDKRVKNAPSFNLSSREFISEMSEAELDELERELTAKGRTNTGTGNTSAQIGRLLDDKPALRKHLSIADVVTPEGRKNIRRISPELDGILNKRYGAGTPKFVQTFNPYNSELAQYNSFPRKYSSLREYLYAIGGARMQSFSDFIVENWFDYCQIVADLSARKLPMHTYTKEIALAKLFGMTGIKINMSLIPDVDKRFGKEYAGLTQNENGEWELIWGDTDRYKATGGKSYMQSINFNDAVALQNDPRYSKNVGTIAIGVSDRQIRMMLDDNRIRMIIPYHKSGMNKLFAFIAGTDFYNDYESVQSTSVAYLVDKNGKQVQLELTKDQKAKLTAYNFNETLQELGDARAAAKAYLEWCADSSQHSITIKGETYNAVLTPKFADFSDHRNYYKLLEDFNTYDSITEEAAPQGDVQQIYPEDFEDILEAELSAREKYNKRQHTPDQETGKSPWQHAIGEIDAFLSTHTAADTLDFAEKHGVELSDDERKRGLAARKNARASLPKSKAAKQLAQMDTVADLYAIHNITPALLTEALDRNGLIMPSLAITNKKFSAFGEISLLFDKGTVDPTENAQNKLYGADAWTPTQTRLKKNAKFNTDRLVRSVNGIKTAIGTKFSKELFPVTPKQFKEAVTNADGSVYDAFSGNIGMQTAYAIESGIIKKIPTKKDGTLDMDALADALEAHLDTDAGWRGYKKWLGSISDTVIESYDNATNDDILNNMKAQPETAKTFKLSENGELVVPAAEYATLDEARSNKGRLSNDTETATKAVAGELLSWAKSVSETAKRSTRAVVSAVNKAFAHRYDVASIVRTFADNGIKISKNAAKTLQDLYKKAVELPTQYFESKPQREVLLDEIKAVVMPNRNGLEELKSRVEGLGIDVVEYEDGSDESRLQAVQEFENLRFSQRKGNGYSGYSMSNNAVSAYENGEMPISKWTKEALLDAVAAVNPDAVDLIKKVNIATLRNALLLKSSWHHTSSHYNQTDFYSLDENAVSNLDAKTVSSWAVVKPEAKSKSFRGDIRYTEWSGTAKHRKASQKVLRDVNIQEKGSFYIVTDDNGTELLRKKIGSSGTYVTNQEADAARKKAEADAEATRIANSSDAANALYDKLAKEGRQFSSSGNIYAYGRKPSAYNYENAESYFKVGEQRLTPNQNGGYIVETWDGKKWVAEGNNNIRYSQMKTTDGRYVAVLDSDILASLPEGEWDNAKKEQAKKAAKEALRRYSDGIVVNGVRHTVSRASRREYTRSNDTERLYRIDRSAFADKMRTAGIIDDVLLVTTGWKNDGGLKHSRTDSFVDFVKGWTLIMSGSSKYRARVVVGITASGEAVFYDITNMQPTDFEIEKAESPTTATTTESIGDIHEDSAGTIISENSDDVNPSPKNSRSSSPKSIDMSNRGLLANALESTATDEASREALAAYKADIARINEMETRLREVRAEIKRLSFARGTRDNARISELRAEATRLSNNISTLDKRLLRAETGGVLQAILERERAAARRRADKRARDIIAEERDKAAAEKRSIASHYQEQRKTAVEKRHKTAMRNKIKKVVKDLDSILNRGTKERNVKNDVRGTVSSALTLADILFSDEIRNEDIVALGAVTATDAEQALLDQYEVLVKERDATEDSIVYDRVRRKLADLDKKLADLFTRERARLNRATVASAIHELSVAYDSLKNKPANHSAFAYEEAVSEQIKQLEKDLGGTVMRDMTMSQLEKVYLVFRLVEYTVRESNSIFKKDRTLNLAQMTEATQREIMEWFKTAKDDPTATGYKVSEWLRHASWGELKPSHAFERLGSETFKKLFWDAIEAEGVWARDIEEAGRFLSEQVEKNGYRNWDMETAHSFDLPSGQTLKLTLQDMMSVYAYSKRDQAYKHMTVGGFQFDTGKTYKDDSGKTRVHLSDLYVVDDAVIAEIVSKLEGMYDGKVKAYVDAVQAYLTDVMGAKGNEVSRIRYGIDLFRERIYFPLKSATDYRASNETQIGATETVASLAGVGFAKETIPEAGNPIVLQGFDEIVNAHIDSMSKYHAFLLPIENLRRVFDNTTITEDGQNYISTKAIIHKVFGKSAESYFQQYITDLNGGTIAKGYNSEALNMFSRFKATAVGASLSVVVQQPMAIIRAMDMIDPKYLVVGKLGKHEGETLYAEIKKYAPVAIIKEMGGFDVGSSRTAVDYLTTRTDKGVKRVMDEINDKSMWMAGKADELGWGIIWKMVKREVMGEQKLQYGTPEFFEACGKRFTEVIVNTQVYDSVNSRSWMMRSKNDLAKFMTSFMGEPTTVINMAYTAMLKAHRATGAEKAKAMRGLGRTMGVLLVSTLLTTLTKSFVYAMRDDDDDEAFLERWAKHFGGNMVSDLNPMTMLPLARDLVSIFEGFTVERPDMTLIANAISSAKKLINDGAEFDEVLSFIGDVGNLFNVPAKNIIRDVKGIANFVTDFFDNIHPTDMGGAFVEGITGKEQAKADALYEAIVNGDSGKLEVIKGQYKTEEAYETALRKALRENDSRIREAAVARNNGDTAEYARIVREIIAEGNFSQDTVVAAVNATINAINKEEEENNESQEPQEDTADKATSIYNGDDINDALESGDTRLALEIIDDIIQTKIENGAEEKSAKASVKSSITSYWKPLYKAAYKAGDTEEMKRIRLLLKDTGLYGRASEILDTCKGWVKD